MSLYPQDQEINMFGEILKYPNMGEDGKFTNGSFSDPKIKPSFIPATDAVGLSIKTKVIFSGTKLA